MKISQAIRRIRQARGLTLDGLAKRSNLTKGYLSKVENAKSSPPVSTLQNLALALGVDISEFFDVDNQHDCLPDGLDIVRNSENNNGIFTEAGYTYKPLVKHLKNKYMSPFLMIVKKGKTRAFSHDSEEFGYIIKGGVRFEYEDQNYILKEGDGFYFDSRKHHRIINEQTEPAVIIAVNFNYRRF